MKVNTEMFKDWLDENGPNGIAKLAIETGLSVSLLQKVRSGVAPKKQSTRKRILAALGFNECEFFPSGEREGKAS